VRFVVVGTDDKFDVAVKDGRLTIRFIGEGLQQGVSIIPECDNVVSIVPR
jgi:hypothetical protein